MKNLIKFGFITLLAACSGEGIDTSYVDDAGTYFGQHKQFLSSQANKNAGTKYLTGVFYDDVNDIVSGTCMNVMGANQTCFLPPFKTLSFKLVNSTCTVSEFNTMSVQGNSVIQLMNSTLGNNGWNISRNDTTGIHTVTCTSLGSVTVAANGGPDGIRSYSQVRCNTDFDNDVNDQGLPGIWSRYTDCAVRIDMADINARGATNTEDALIAFHAIGNGMVKILGVGDLDQVFGVVSNRSITPIINNRQLFSTGQSCRTKHYTIGNPVVFGFKTDKNCDNN